MYINLKWLVIPGGPGLSNKYLKSALSKAFQNYNLYFYNAYGSPESNRSDVKLKEMIQQIEEEILKLGDNIGLITHSFGNYLVLRLLEKNNPKIKAMIMLNPMPFIYEDWKISLANIIKKVPEKVLEEINKLSSLPEQGEIIFRLIYPFYTGKNPDYLSISIPFNIIACNSIAAEVSDYNDTALISEITIPIIRIVGEADPFYHNKDLINDKTIVLKNLGHYPFLENLSQFSDVIPQIEELLCTKTMTIKSF